jgi:hypothetical protein
MQANLINNILKMFGCNTYVVLYDLCTNLTCIAMTVLWLSPSDQDWRKFSTQFSRLLHIVETNHVQGRNMLFEDLLSKFHDLTRVLLVLFPPEMFISLSYCYYWNLKVWGVLHSHNMIPCFLEMCRWLRCRDLQTAWLSHKPNCIRK